MPPKMGSRKSERTNMNKLDIAAATPLPLSPPQGMDKNNCNFTEIMSEVRNDIAKSTQSPKDYVGNQLALFKKSINDQIVEINNGIRKEIEKVLEETRATNAKVEELEKDVHNLRDELANSKQSQKALLSQIDELKERIVSQDAYSRRENLVIGGIPLSENESCLDKVKDFFKSKLLINADVVENMPIQRCHRKQSREAPAPIIVRFLNFPDRMTIWKAKANLKNTKFTIWEDFPPEIAARRSQLKPILRKALNLKKKATISGDKLIIDSKAYTVKTLNTLPKELDPAQIATRTVGNVTGFFSRQSPLSNFYDAPIEIRGRKYDHVEQYFQAEKALFAERPDIAHRIHQSPDPAICKRLGDALEVDANQWLPTATDVMSRAVRIKFQTNERAKEFLLNTDKNVIAEAGPCLKWGTGLKLSDPKLGDAREWKGENLLGKILMTVRKELLDVN